MANEFKLRKLFVWETLHDKIKENAEFTESVLSKTITLSAKELRDAANLPVEILPGLDAGKAYLLLYGYTKFIPGAIQYDGNTSLYIGTATSASINSTNEYQLVGIFAGLAVPRPDPYFSMLINQKVSGFGTDQIKEGESIKLYRNVLSTVGDGIIEVTIFYRILDL